MTTSNKNKLNNGAILKNFKSQIIEKQSEIVDVMTVVIGSMSIMGVCLVLLLTLAKNASDANIIIFSAFSLLIGFIIFPICILKKNITLISLR